MEASREDSSGLEEGYQLHSHLCILLASQKQRVQCSESLLCSAGCCGRTAAAAASQPADCWHRQNTGRGNVGAFFFFFSLSLGFFVQEPHPAACWWHHAFSLSSLRPSFSCFPPSLCPDVLIPNICTCWRCVFHRRRRLGSCVCRRGKKAAPRLSTAFTITIVSLVSLGPVPFAQALLFGRFFSTSYTIYTERTLQQEHISNIDVTRAASGCSILLFSG